MKLAVDIGGSKTLLAVFDDTDHLLAEQKFKTAKNYDTFLSDLQENVSKLKKSSFSACAAAIPGRLDRKRGTVLSCGNLDWKNKPIQKDLSRIIGRHVPIENDSKLGALYEAHNVIHDYKKTLYVTVSTGIGAGVIIDGVIDQNLVDCEVGSMALPHKGKLQPWESFASGKAFHEQTGKLFSELSPDAKEWKFIGEQLAPGFFNICSVVQPEVIIVGGGAGKHLKHFIKPLKETFKTFRTDMVPLPPIKPAKKPEEAVVHGCLVLMKQS